MKILLINPNTSAEMTRTIDATGKKYCLPGTEIVTVSPKDGPGYIGNAYDGAIQAPKVMALVEQNLTKFDYFVIACGSDPGLDACRTITKNVIGIGEAAILTACAVAKRFSFLATTPTSAAGVPGKLRSMGIDPSRCASARPVGVSDEIVRKRFEKFDIYLETGRKCIQEDGAEAIIFSCAGMANLKERLEQELKVPVIAGVISAVKIAEQFGAVPRA